MFRNVHRVGWIRLAWSSSLLTVVLQCSQQQYVLALTTHHARSKMSVGREHSHLTRQQTVTLPGLDMPLTNHWRHQNTTRYQVGFSLELSAQHPRQRTFYVAWYVSCLPLTRTFLPGGILFGAEENPWWLYGVFISYSLVQVLVSYVLQTKLTVHFTRRRVGFARRLVLLTVLFVFVVVVLTLTPLEPQSRLGTKLLEFDCFVPRTGLRF